MPLPGQATTGVRPQQQKLRAQYFFGVAGLVLLSGVAACTDAAKECEASFRAREFERAAELCARAHREHGKPEAAAYAAGAAYELGHADEVNAWADGERVVVSSGIVEKCPSDDMLALVIAHEMAHNLLHHNRRLASATSAQGRQFQRYGEGSAAMLETEEEADRRAVSITAAAGYDLSEALPDLRGLMASDISVAVAATHPETERRLALLKTAIAQVGKAGATPLE